ncbi:hypothetical protein [Pseudobutyrivibrio sp. MD2005]|uniref:hypothetical protein n=1 Tax=Pseudobutyrivibrio sp. MD2005 TaxID=1410616 RepID=UPI000481950B|nr:hypothetical protein [Pseudobutyrivibrio sp. MD2005]
MDMSFMTIFDLVIGVLGAYLVFIGIKCSKKGEVDPMMITAEELTKCSDIKGLSKYLMPKTAIFGAFCVVFGAQGFLNDTGKVSFPQTVNVVFLIAFVLVWVVFSIAIRKAKKTYIH